MKAFHFTLIGGERGTLAGCDNDMTVEQAMEVLNFQFPYRLESIEASGKDWPAPVTTVDERHFSGRLPRISDAHAEAVGPMLIVQRLQNIRKRAKCPPAG